MLETGGLRKRKDNIVRAAHDALHAKIVGEADARAEELLVPAQEAWWAAERHAREDVHPHRRAEDEAAALGEAEECEVRRLAVVVDRRLDPVTCCVQELVPGTAPAGEEKGGDQVQARHCIALVETSLFEYLGLLEEVASLLVQLVVELLGRRGWGREEACGCRDGLGLGLNVQDGEEGDGRFNSGILLGKEGHDRAESFLVCKAILDTEDLGEVAFNVEFVLEVSGGADEYRNIVCSRICIRQHDLLVPSG